MTFHEWLFDEIKKSGLSYAEIARRGEISHARISQVLAGEKPGAEFCIGVARGLNKPPEEVLRLAGYLPPLGGPADSPVIGQIVDVMKRLTEEERDDVLDYAIRRYERQQEKEKAQKDQEKGTRRNTPGQQGDISAKAIPERLPRLSPVVERLLMAGAGKEIDPELRRDLKAAVEKMTPEQRAAKIRYLLERANFVEVTESRPADPAATKGIAEPLEEDPH